MMKKENTTSRHFVIYTPSNLGRIFKIFKKSEIIVTIQENIETLSIFYIIYNAKKIAMFYNASGYDNHLILLKISGTFTHYAFSYISYLFFTFLKILFFS